MKLLLALLLAAQGGDSASDPVVLRQGEESFTAGKVLEAVGAYNPAMIEQLADEQLRQIHFRSLRFLREIHSFADLLLLDESEIPKVDSDALLEEASEWTNDRGLKLFPEPALASYGPQIEVRARLIALQPEEFTTQELRSHFLRSVPEFFGELTISWIRVPVADPRTGVVLSPEDRRKQYELLERVADDLASGKLEWAAAVQRHCLDPVTKERDGYVGRITRDMAPKFEEPLLHELFRDLGYKKIENKILRGPITGDQWLYLVRIESVNVFGVVEMNRVLPEVERSLRNLMLSEKLAALRAGAERTVTLP